LRTRIDQLEKRQTQDDAVINVIHRYYIAYSLKLFIDLRSNDFMRRIRFTQLPKYLSDHKAYFVDIGISSTKMFESSSNVSMQKLVMKRKKATNMMQQPHSSHSWPRGTNKSLTRSLPVEFKYRKELWEKSYKLEAKDTV